jgi:hypothetical protein
MVSGFPLPLHCYNTRLALTFASPALQISLSFLLFINTCSAAPSPSALHLRDDADQAVVDPADLKPVPANRYLPAQIGGIVGSYAVSLVLVAAALLVLSKKRREHLTAGENEIEFLSKVDKPQQFEPPPDHDYPDHWKELQLQQLQQLHHQHDYPHQEVPTSPTSLGRSIPRSPVALGVDCDYSPAAQQQQPDVWPVHAAHRSAQFGLTLDTAQEPGPSRAQYILPSPTSTTRSPLGYDETVDQSVVEKDRKMAQTQLEEMYKYAFEHEEAKLKGVDAPPIPMEKAPAPRGTLQRPTTAGAPITKKDRIKPAALNLSAEPEKQSRMSSLFSALRSPKKNKVQAVSISSPIMTPMSGTFPRESQEMNTIPPRQYAPAPPPPVPTNQAPYQGRAAPQYQPLTPEYSPDSSQSIDERLVAMATTGNTANHSRNPSSVPTEPDPSSAISENSQTPLMGLPTSPKPGVNRFPSLPASPRPGQQTFNLPVSPRPGQQTFGLPTSPQPSQTTFNLASPKGSTFSRANAPSAVRTGGSLPLRAYEPALSSPSAQSTQTKQTVFERMAPLSPRGAMTPYTGTAVPYSPYQPFSPMVPVTPSLVTKADRKRMKKLEPKTPTLAMVKGDDEIW